MLTPLPPPIPKKTWAIAAITGAGAFMAMLDATVVNLALASIRADLASGLSAVQWVATGYLIALAVSLPAAAWLGMRIGYGRVWTASLAGFVAASGLCALAPDIVSLIGARCLQGLAAGLMIPAGQAIVGSAAAPNQLGRIMGILGLAVAMGPAVGPAVGGVLLEMASWRWLFWINIPLGIVALIAAGRLVPAGRACTGRGLDRLALLLAGTGLPLLLYGAADIGGRGPSWPATGATLIGLALVISFIRRSLRTTHPLIDLRLLCLRRFSSASATTGLTGANLYGGLLLIPLYLHFAAGLSQVETGAMLLAMGLGSAFALPAAGWLTDRHAPGGVSLAGAALLLVTTVPFILPSPPSPAILLAALILRGIGLAWAQMPAMSAAYTTVTAKQMGDAATLVNIIQRVGGALGAIAVVVMLGDTGNYGRGFAVLLGIAGLTLATSAALARQPDRPQPA